MMRQGDDRVGYRARWALSVLLAVAIGMGLGGCATASGQKDEVGRSATPEEGAVTDGQADASGSNEAEVADEKTEGAGESLTPSESDIPPGREIAEGGGGPLTYTFREAWRRALPEARRWREGAYLIAVVGNYINSDGVPSDWRFTFVDSDAPDAGLFVYMDSWGTVTETEEITGDALESNVSPYDSAIPTDVIDTDQVVSIATELLGSRYDLNDTKDPRVALGFSPRDGSGPYWAYTVFYTSTAEYVSTRLDARTGAEAPQE